MTIKAHADVAFTKIMDVEKRPKTNVEKKKWRGGNSNHHGRVRVWRSDIACGFGGDIDAPEDSSGISPAMACSKYGHAECLGVLIAAGARLEARDRYGRSAAMMAAEHNHWQCLWKLVAAGAELEARDHGGMTAAMWCAYAGSSECEEVLLEAGCSMESANQRGETAEDIAREKVHQDFCVRVLSWRERRELAEVAMPSSPGSPKKAL